MAAMVSPRKTSRDSSRRVGRPAIGSTGSAAARDRSTVKNPRPTMLRIVAPAGSHEWSVISYPRLAKGGRHERIPLDPEPGRLRAPDHAQGAGPAPRHPRRQDGLPGGLSLRRLRRLPEADAG